MLNIKLSLPNQVPITALITLHESGPERMDSPVKQISQLLISVCIAFSAFANATESLPGATGPLRSAAGLWTNEEVKQSVSHQVGGDPHDGAFQYISMAPIFFDHNTHHLNDDSRLALNAAVEYISKNQSLIKRILIEGYTDYTASLDYNDKLSEQRSDIVRSYLTVHGINPRLVKITANGERAPTDIHWTPLGQQRNRQVAIHAIQWVPN